MSSPHKKVDMIAMPPKLPKLEPGGSLAPQKSRTEKMEDAFDVIFKKMQQLRLEMTTISDQALEDRKKFEKIQDKCLTAVDQMEDLVTDFKIKAKCAKEYQEDLETKLTKRLNSLGTSSSAGHHQLDALEKQQKKIQQDLSNQKFNVEFFRQLT